MSDQPYTAPLARPRLSAAALLTWAGAIALAGLTALLAFYNAAGWNARGFPLLAALAVATEAIAFLMAVCAELAWRRGGHIAVRALRVGACMLILAGCELFNAAGSHEAWTGTVAERAETLTQPRRNAIAAEDVRLRGQIAAAQARIDMVARPDCGLAGPLTCQSRTAAWDAQTAADRAEKAENERLLRALDRTVPAPDAPFDAAWVWGFLTFLGFVKVAGLWAIGVAVIKGDETRTAETGTAPSTETDVVRLIPAGVDRAIFVRALRAAGLSFGEIERQYGIPKGSAHRLASAGG